MSQDIVYIIGATDCPVKVGYTTDLGARLSSLQTGSPDRLIVHDVVRVQSGFGRTAERQAHQHLADKRRYGSEWFDVDAVTAASVVRQVVSAIRESNLRDIHKHDLIGRLEITQTVSDFARPAVVALKTLAAAPGGNRRAAPYLQAVEISAGRVGLDLVNRCVLGGAHLEDLFSGHADVLANARRALAKAINALSEHHLEQPDGPGYKTVRNPQY